MRLGRFWQLLVMVFLGRQGGSESGRTMMYERSRGLGGPVFGREVGGRLPVPSRRFRLVGASALTY